MAAGFAETFGLRLPFVQGPMGLVAGPRLVAAVAEAGGLGILPIWYLPPEAAVGTIAATQALTDRPFAVNLRADLLQHDLIAAALDRGVRLIHLFWGDPGPSMPAIREAGARMLATVSDAETTVRALDAGAAGLIAQGVEAGGHVWGEIPRDALLDITLRLAGDVPVAAAGGLVEPADVAGVFARGASGALFGTRMAATGESDAHPDYKAALVAAGSSDTVRTLCFDGGWPDAPHRVLRNSTFRAWDAAGGPATGGRPGEGEVVLRFPGGGPEIPRYDAACPGEGMSGEIEAAALYAGTGVGKISGVETVAEVFARLATALPR